MTPLQLEARMLSSTEELPHQRDVGGLRRLLRRSLLLRPGIELGAAHHVEHPRPAARGVSFGSLLVERVQLEQRLVRGALLQRLHLPLRLGELLVEGHVGYSTSMVDEEDPEITAPGA